MTTVLVADDEPEVRSYLGLALTSYGYGVELARDGEEAVGCLERDGDRISLLVLDLIMPRKDGFETLKEVHRAWPRLPVITLSGCCTPANVASVLKGGAVDFLAKPISHDDLLRAIQSALAFSRVDRTGEAGQEGGQNHATDVSSEKSWSQRVHSLLTRIGASDAPVLLRGETGVGKEVFARELHARSKRSDRPFLKLNCAALPSELVESELFGYEKGAFTGAVRSTPGKFEIANRGTILLDEIGDMDFKLQAKLLQVLQDREFLKLGANEASRVDVRVMAATHCDLEKAIEQRRFREDLYYRLNIIEVNVPPLRERKDEIISLAEYFLNKHAPGESPELPMRLRHILLDHDWPGNVRQLENIMRKFLIFRSVEAIAAELKTKTPKIMSTGDVYQPAPHLLDPENRQAMQPVDEPREPANADYTPGNQLRKASRLAQCEEARRKAETEIIFEVLNSTLWNRKQAAKLLNVDYKALLYKMKKLGIGEAPQDASAGDDDAA